MTRLVEIKEHESNRIVFVNPRFIIAVTQHGAETVTSVHVDHVDERYRFVLTTESAAALSNRIAVETGA